MESFYLKSILSFFRFKGIMFLLFTDPFNFFYQIKKGRFRVFPSDGIIFPPGRIEVNQLNNNKSDPKGNGMGINPGHLSYIKHPFDLSFSLLPVAVKN
jgi:hypothetical protein